MDSENQWTARRLQPEEAEAIKDFEQQNEKYRQYYPRHLEWLDRAIEQLETGERVAFGAFPPPLAMGKLLEQPETPLAAAVILKISPYTSTIELKNWVFNEKLTSVPDLEKAQTQLLKRVEAYGQRKGFRHFEMEMPPEEKDTIAFLFSHGFSIASITNGRYKTGNYSYVFEKRLLPRYASDPFDFQEIVHWILTSYYPQFRDIEVQPMENGKGDYMVKACSFQLTGPEIVTEIDTQGVGERARFRGQAVAQEEALDPEDIRKLFQKREGFRLLFAQDLSQQVKDHCQVEGIQAFDGKDIDILLGRKDTVETVFFARKEIGGMVVTVGPNYYPPMEQREMLGGNFTYFLLGGGIGRYAAGTVPVEDPSPDERRLVLFYFPTVNERFQDKNVDLEAGLHFYAEITHITINKPGVLWEEAEEDAQPLLLQNQEQLLFYTYHSENRDIVALHCTSLQRFRDPVNFVQLVRDSDGDVASKFYTSELTASGIVTSYITKQCRDVFYKKVSEAEHTMLRQHDEEEYPFDIAISYPRDLRDRIREVAHLLRGRNKEVFFDEFYSAQLGRPNLIEDLERVYQKRSDLVVVFFGKGYMDSKWCGLEWRQVKVLIFDGRPADVMLFRDQNIDVNELLSPGDHAIDIDELSTEEISELILNRLANRRID